MAANEKEAEMGETVFDLLDGHRHIIPARLLARIESAHARELQSEKARADAAEADARRYRWLWRRHPAALLNIFDPHGAHDYDETDSLIDAAMKVGAPHD